MRLQVGAVQSAVHTTPVAEKERPIAVEEVLDEPQESEHVDLSVKLFAHFAPDLRASRETVNASPYAVAGAWRVVGGRRTSQSGLCVFVRGGTPPGKLEGFRMSLESESP